MSGNFDSISTRTTSSGADTSEQPLLALAIKTTAYAQLDLILEFFGVSRTELQVDKNIAERYKCGAESGQIQLQQDNIGSDAFKWSGRKIDFRYDMQDDSYDVSLQDLKENITFTVFAAGKILLQELLANAETELTEDRKKQISFTFDAMQKDYEIALQRIEDAVKTKYGVHDESGNVTYDPNKLLEKTISVPFSHVTLDGQTAMYEANANGIIGSSALHIAEFLRAVESEAKVKEGYTRSWVSALRNAELDILSGMQRPLRMVVNKDDKDNPESGYMLEIVIPITDVSSLDRRAENDLEKQKRANGSIQVNIHLDKHGKVISKEILHRGASANAIDADETAILSLARTTSAIKNDLRLQAFLRIRNALLEQPNLSPIELKKKCATGTMLNQSLMSTVGDEYDYTMQMKQAYEQLENTELGLTPELIDELTRLHPEFDFTGFDDNWIDTDCVFYSTGTNVGRGLDGKHKIAGILGISIPGYVPPQTKIMETANRKLFAMSLNRFNEIYYNDSDTVAKALLLKVRHYLLKVETLLRSEPNVSIANNWSKVRGEFLRDLDALNITSPQSKTVKFINIFAMHMENNLKPQIPPLAMKNILLLKTDRNLSFVRQVLVGMLFLDIQGQSSKGKSGLGSRDVLLINCKSAKDRTAILIACREAWQKIIDDDGVVKYKDLDKYVQRMWDDFPHIIKTTISRAIVADNCPGVSGFLGQNQLVKMKGIKFIHAIYPIKVQKFCNFAAHNATARLNKCRYQFTKGVDVGIEGDFANKDRKRELRRASLMWKETDEIRETTSGISDYKIKANAKDIPMYRNIKGILRKLSPMRFFKSTSKSEAKENKQETVASDTSKHPQA